MARDTFTDSKGVYVKVKKGDTLSRIASDFKNHNTYPIKNWNQLATINKQAGTISNPNRIAIGQKIYLKLGSSGSSSTTKTNSNTNRPTITAFGEQSNADNTLFATWEWDKSKTDKYQVRWDYATGDGVWFVGNHSDTTYKQATYSIPNNATKVRFKVKPIAKGTTKNNKTTYPWTAEWSETKTWIHEESEALAEMTPSNPSASLDPDNKYQLLASLSVGQDLLDEGATDIEFLVREDGSTKNVARATTKIINKSASHAFKVATGKKYIVYCRAYKSSLKIYSKYAGPTAAVLTLPAVPSGLKVVSATPKDGNYEITLKWNEVTTASSYEIQRATRKELFDVSDQVNSIEHNNQEKPTERLIQIPQEEGSEYFFRVRAKNSAGESKWSSIISLVVGKEPAAPTTWSSTTTAIVGEEVTLYWVHNSEDGSSQVKAEIQLIIDGETQDLIVKENTTDEDERDKTSFYSLTATGNVIKWKIRTMGVTGNYGDWSVERTINVSATPTLSVFMEDKEGNDLDTLTAFPFYIKATAGPSPQRPISYHVKIVSNETYETVDQLGNSKTVSVGEELYSKYFDTDQNPLNVGFSAENIDLENGIEYTVICVVSMNSGLTAETSHIFTVNWGDTLYVPNAEIMFDADTFTASILPYCENVEIKFHKVNKVSTKYYDSNIEIGAVYGEEVSRARTDTGEQVYSGTTADGEDVYYCMVEERTQIHNALLSVYRREFDGTFTEIATGLDSANSTTVTDPHPALDYARYRIVATDKTSGAVSYYDPPGLPTDCHAIIVQWDEQWSEFDTEEDAELEQPPWTGSLVKLPYNVDVSEDTQPDVSTIKYIGRSNPVAYYGTQVGQTASLSVEIERDDVDTVYALRRLARWMGDVYVREPSGIGYWANITVSFSQKHTALTIPVSLSITRVEGGI